MRSEITRIGCGICFAGSLAIASVASAADGSGSGTVTYIPIHMESTKLPGGKTLQRIYLKGVVLADKADVPLHLSAMDCGGAVAISADAKQEDGAGHCTAVDKDGDMWAIWWRDTTQSRAWGFLAGTGKFKGIEGGGTTTVLAQLEDGRQVISWKGTWKMK